MAAMRWQSASSCFTVSTVSSFLVRLMAACILGRVEVLGENLGRWWWWVGVRKGFLKWDLRERTAEDGGGALVEGKVKRAASIVERIESECGEEEWISLFRVPYLLIQQYGGNWKERYFRNQTYTTSCICKGSKIITIREKKITIYISTVHFNFTK